MPSAPRALPRCVTFATNNGDIGGGEVMLLRMAEACRELDVDVTVVAPTGPGALAQASRDAGFATVALAASTRREWMRALRRWDARRREGLLWCNGLVPAAATTGRRDRVVHLHQLPMDAAQWALAAGARVGARATVVPSASMARSIRDARVLPNWTLPMHPAATRRNADVFTVGFLGRPSPDKGMLVLADAMRMLDADDPGRYRLIVGGEPRFVSAHAQAQVESALASIAHLTEQCGWVAAADFFDEIDLLVVPSVWSEPFGLVAAEAMSARMPVVVTDAGALPEVVGPEGRVVAAGDARALAAAVAALRDRDTATAQCVEDGLLTGAGNARRPADLDMQYDRWLELFSPSAGRARMANLLTALLAVPVPA